jgi:hypothetical protein
MSAIPMTEMRSYIRRKLEMARDFPRESRLFANEILQGAPREHADELEGRVEVELVDEKAQIIRAWMRAGKIARMRSLAPDLLDLGDHPALCRFRRTGARGARTGSRRRRPLRRCRALPGTALHRGTEAEGVRARPRLPDGPEMHYILTLPLIDKRRGKMQMNATSRPFPSKFQISIPKAGSRKANHWKAWPGVRLHPAAVSGVMLVPVPKLEDLLGSLARNADPTGYRDRNDRY